MTTPLSNESLDLIRSGKAQAKTAVELMQARYRAFETGDIDFIMNSHDPDTVHQIDRDGTEAWAKQSKWTGLDIVSTELGGEGDMAGTVEFVAHYAVKGTPLEHRERATFRKHNGRWVFVDGAPVAGPPVRREEPKIGRNDPCSCGSGKKYKKCHGASA
ncbi:MAG TPA: YchJ family metal-binding protein [Polyangiaceae bacterium]|nr:YchJ family metal-binding protein [Polyangiaceae bacterium]